MSLEFAVKRTNDLIEQATNAVVSLEDYLKSIGLMDAPIIHLPSSSKVLEYAPVLVSVWTKERRFVLRDGDRSSPWRAIDPAEKLETLPLILAMVQALPEWLETRRKPAEVMIGQIDNAIQSIVRIVS